MAQKIPKRHHCTLYCLLYEKAPGAMHECLLDKGEGPSSHLDTTPPAQGAGSFSPRPSASLGRFPKPRSLVPMRITAAAGW